MARTIALLMMAACLMGCSSLPRQLAPPQVELAELRLLQASFDGQRFAVRLVLNNPNPVPIPVRAVEFDVRLAGEGLLNGRSLSPFTMPARGRNSVDVEVFSNLVSSVSRLLAFVQGPANGLEYEVQGELELDVPLREPIGFYQRGVVPLVVPQ
jgi:LEA14-like dessication related protein